MRNLSPTWISTAITPHIPPQSLRGLAQSMRSRDPVTMRRFQTADVSPQATEPRIHDDHQ
jgi:hypothetical protein